METTSAGALVKVAGGGPVLDGIVFDVPSRTRAVVAVVDPTRGPMFRTVHPDTLTERTEEAAADHALRLLIRRTPRPTRSQETGGNGARQGRPGHARTATHRTTGK